MITCNILMHGPPLGVQVYVRMYVVIIFRTYLSKFIIIIQFPTKINKNYNILLRYFARGKCLKHAVVDKR